MLALLALGIALLQQSEGVSPRGCTYRSMVLVPETIEARRLPVSPRARAELCASETGRIEIVVTVWPEQENTKPAEEAPGYPEACGTVSECVQVVAVDPDGGRWIVGVDRTRRAPFVLQVVGNGRYRDATQEDGPWHMRLNPGDDVLWQAAFILEEGFRARRIEYCRPVNVCLAGEIEDTPDNEESAEHEWFWMAGASIGRWHPQAGTRGSVGLRYVYRTPERELGFVVAPVEPLPPWEPMHLDPNLHHPRPLPDMRPEHLLWRIEDGDFVWVDTRRIDRSTGFVAYEDRAGVPVRALVTVAEPRKPSFAALAAGDYSEDPLAFRIALLRPSPFGDVPEQERTWRSIAGLVTRLGKPEGAGIDLEWNASTSALAAKGWEHEVRIGARAPIGQGRVVASHERIARGFGEGIAFVPNAGVEISRLIGEVVRENEAFRLEAALASRLRDGGIEAEGLHGGSDHEFSGLVSWERAFSKGSSVGVGMTLTHMELGGITLGPYPGIIADAIARIPSSEALIRISSRLHRTPIYARMMPGYGFGIDMGISVPGESGQAGLVLQAEHTTICEANEQGRRTAEGCALFGKALGVEGFWDGQLAVGASIGAQARWARQWSVAAERPTSRGDARVGVDVQLGRRPKISFAGECSRTGRAVCRASGSISVRTP